MTAPTPTPWYCVQIYELSGAWIGRLTPEGGTTRLTIHAVMLDEFCAAEIADEINDEGRYLAKSRPF